MENSKKKIGTHSVTYRVKKALSLMSLARSPGVWSGLSGSIWLIVLNGVVSGPSLSFGPSPRCIQYPWRNPPKAALDSHEAADEPFQKVPFLVLGASDQSKNGRKM
jgi:hypothetical protein